MLKRFILLSLISCTFVACGESRPSSSSGGHYQDETDHVRSVLKDESTLDLFFRRVDRTKWEINGKAEDQQMALYRRPFVETLLMSLSVKLPNGAVTETTDVIDLDLSVKLPEARQAVDLKAHLQRNPETGGLTSESFTIFGEDQSETRLTVSCAFSAANLPVANRNLSDAELKELIDAVTRTRDIPQARRRFICPLLMIEAAWMNTRGLQQGSTLIVKYDPVLQQFLAGQERLALLSPAPTEANR